MSLIQRAISFIENEYPGIIIQETNYITACKYYFSSVCGKRGYVLADKGKVIMMETGESLLNLKD